MGLGHVNETGVSSIQHMSSGFAERWYMRYIENLSLYRKGRSSGLLKDIAVVVLQNWKPMEKVH